MSKLGIFKSKNSEIGNKILKDISLLPFNYDNNKKIIEDIFNKYKNNLSVANNENEILIKMIKKYEIYFNNNWKIFFEN